MFNIFKSKNKENNIPGFKSPFQVGQDIKDEIYKEYTFMKNKGFVNEMKKKIAFVKQAYKSCARQCSSAACFRGKEDVQCEQFTRFVNDKSLGETLNPCANGAYLLSLSEADKQNFNNLQQTCKIVQKLMSTIDLLFNEYLNKDKTNSPSSDEYIRIEFLKEYYTTFTKDKGIKAFAALKEDAIEAAIRAFQEGNNDDSEDTEIIKNDIQDFVDNKVQELSLLDSDEGPYLLGSDGGSKRRRKYKNKSTRKYKNKSRRKYKNKSRRKNKSKRK